VGDSVPQLDAHLSGHHTGIRGRVTKEMIPTVIAALGLFLALVAFHSRGYGIGVVSTTRQIMSGRRGAELATLG
jgi:ribosomal protein S8